MAEPSDKQKKAKRGTPPKKELSLYKQVVAFMLRNKDATNAVLYEKFKDYQKGSVRDAKATYLKRRKIKTPGAKSPGIKLPKKIDFPLFCKTLSYPPYYGLYRWQEECYNKIWKQKFSVVVVPRDSGKSVLWGNLSQWCMEYDNYDVLYLGWTDRRKEVAENVYNFFLLWDEIEKGGSKISSPYHFKTKRGGRFDTYLITSKETLGKHAVGSMDRFDRLTPEDIKQLGKAFTEAIKEKYMKDKDKFRKLLIFIDDPIDETFRKERHKEQTVETKYNSTIANINADKVINSGTRKFQEDFFYFIYLKYKDKLTKYLRRTHLCTPNLEDLDIFSFINFDKLDREDPKYMEFMEKVIDKALKHPCYNPDLTEPDQYFIPGGSREDNILVREKWTEATLLDKREEIGEYWWFAEYEGNPHPITGAVWDSVFYKTSWEDWTVYDFAFISVDRATTTGKTSSWTGITVVIRNGLTGKYLVIKDLTGQYDFEECLIIVEEQYKWLRSQFHRARVKVFVEKQGGGDDFISSALSRRMKYAYAIEDIHQTRDKLDRIEDYLKNPIKKAIIEFLDTLRNSELISEIFNFPYCIRFDAIDCLATGIKMSEKYPVGNRREIAERITKQLEQKRMRREVLRSPTYNNPVQNPNFYANIRRGTNRRRLVS